jgi:DNA helicase-2/ATP-dependent DNA helicase PcrA
VINPDDDVARKRAEKMGKNKLKNFDLRFKIYDSRINTLKILDEVLKVTGYLDQYEELNEEDAARLENIKELRSVATEFPVLVEFLEQIALTEKESKRPSYAKATEGKGAVTLMTLHAAKGLEYKTVFMVGMEEGLFPHSRAFMDKEQMEEERRLCYVGMTRAKDKLYMTFARRRLYFGTRSNNPVSRFIADIPEELIENTGQAPLRPARRDFVRGTLDARWGFDEEGNWKWNPDEDINF